MSELAELLADLVRIDSVNPDLVPGGAGEQPIAEFVANWLRSAGVETTLQESGGGRPNVIGRVPGIGGGKALMLNAHMDTVGYAGMSEALSGRIEGNRLYGRGAYDMKGSLAAIMIAAKRLIANPPAGDVLITAVTDEEYASIGTRAIVRDYKADAAIITEPTEMTLTVAHKGFVWIEIETEGRAAHGSLPDEGIDAIAMLAPILQGFQDLDQRLRSGPQHPLLRTGSVHASLVTGGAELSSYPQSAKLSIERRTVPAENPETVQREIDEILANSSANWPNFKATAKQTFNADSYEAEESLAIRSIAYSILKTQLGYAPPVTGGTGWMDSALLAAAGIPTVILGPSGDGAHALEEWVDLDTCEACAAMYEAIAREFCV
jgi:acetylornithine deacetylase